MSIAEDIARFEQNLNELIIKYEQYFLGLEKREPLRLLDDVEKMARKYTSVNIVNTMVKFKYNSIVAKLNSYKQYWNRINRQIEEGKYSRERFKMEKRQQTGTTKPGENRAGEAATARLDHEVEQVYQQFIEARKACQLPVTNITPELIAAAIEKQKPAIISKYHCNKVEFKVVIEEGTPKIKARPKI